MFRWVFIKILCCCGLFFAPFIVLSQEAAPMVIGERLEIPLKPFQNKPKLIPVGENGVMLLESSTQEGNSPKGELGISLYNKSLEQVWNKKLNYNKKLELQQFKYFDDRLFLVFNHSSKEELELVEINVESDVKVHSFYYIKRLEINSFFANKHKAYIGGSLKGLPVVLQLDLERDKIKPIPMAFNSKEVEVQDITSTRSETITVTVSMERKRRKSILIRTVDEEGGQLEDLRLEPDNDHSLLNGRVTKFEDQSQVVIGTYALNNQESSQGFYFTKFNRGEAEFLNYYKFVDLNNFFAFMDDKWQDRMESKVEKKKVKGKDLKVKYRLLVHDVISKEGKYIMVGEAYYPVYRTERVNDYYNRRGYYNTRTVFDGYEYTHAIIVVFDKKGGLLWDNSFKIDGTKVFKLKERVKVYPADQELILVYNLEGKINKLRVKDDQVIEEGLQMVENKFDKIRGADLGESEYWYGRNFIAWGYQRIKNKFEENEKRKRSVFYVNKLPF